MKPLEMAARFAAFAWYAKQRQGPSPITRVEARQFSEQNWQFFLPVAHRGWGRLLLRVATARPNSRHASDGVSRPRRRQVAAPCSGPRPSR
jgi:hypothetical protein